MKKSSTQFAIIGMGSFGATLCRSLFDLGKEVMAIDNNAQLIEDVKDYSTHAVCADATDETVLKSLRIQDFDAVVVCIGGTEPNVFVTLLCKQLGAAKVIAKANNALHKTVLEKIGADMVLFPEEYMGRKVASMLTSPGVLELAELTPAFRIIEIITPEKWEHKSLMEIDIRRRFGTTVLVVKRNDEVVITPSGDFELNPDDEIILCGARQDVEKLRKAVDVEIDFNL